MKLSLTRLLLILVLTVASLTVYSQPVNQVFEEWVTADGTQNYFIKAAVETDPDGVTGNRDCLKVSAPSWGLRRSQTFIENSTFRHLSTPAESHIYGSN